MTTQISREEAPEVQELDAERGQELFDKAARRILGISGDDFLARWDRGEYDEGDEDTAVTRVAMLIPFAR